MANETSNNSNQSWLLRFIKGMFIGSGFIIPGVSGGALAAIFGLYERIIRFLANITKNFKENVIFFIPVGLGAIVSIVILSFGISYVLENYETIVLWFFVGCIVGMIPSLWKEAGKEGRSQKDYVITGVSLVLGIALIYFSNQSIGGQLPINFWSWILCGFLIALGVLVPGLSPSNFIVIFGLYQPMADGFSRLDFSVIIPIAIGGLLTIILFSKLVEYIFEHYYASFFHFIFGIVIASTIMIIPLDYTGFGWVQYLWCVVMLVLGTALGWWMARLEEQYK
ncbi:DUF368 domain-containing protein [Fundicoccus culcitae]|uniref:DUF368 domain-containing protein n=1 Tax=Fundicoccus culcitae TaxID=2969821 RepID=A0ABY5P5E1_9LACT|nr:DUF368 domain-containing protein [Fundicoccus culcitae]UUX33927.1 DUF368 domain-containing protein [Fundicoccus culcitae]